MYTLHMAPPRLTGPTLKVLLHMYRDPADEFYGYELMEACGLASGTLYRILARFRDAQWITWRKEAIDPAEAGRPARTYYKLTGAGALAAAEVESEFGWAGGAAGAPA
jgi:DNA-binding PadR family transcriptional regulator